MGNLRQQWEYVEGHQKTEIINFAQVKNKVNKVYSNSELRTSTLVAFSFLISLSTLIFTDCRFTDFSPENSISSAAGCCVNVK